MSGTRNTLVLSVDIGNSVTKLALVEVAGLRVVARQSVPTTAVPDEVDSVWRALSVGQPGMVTRGIVCSVSAEAAKGLSRWLESIGVVDVAFVSGTAPLPVELDYDAPGMLGADRIAAACWCAHRFAGESCAIVGAGTAVTVDYLDQGRVFRGGAIVPGPSLQWRALHEQTAELPEVAAAGAVPALPGCSTADCMRGGVLVGLAGAVERIAADYRSLVHGVDRVVAHGGAWPVLAPLVRLEVSYEPDAVLLGTVVAHVG